jgi:hypothetical protein
MISTIESPLKRECAGGRLGACGDSSDRRFILVAYSKLLLLMSELWGRTIAMRHLSSSQERHDSKCQIVMTTSLSAGVQSLARGIKKRLNEFNPACVENGLTYEVACSYVIAIVSVYRICSFPDEYHALHAVTLDSLCVGCVRGPWERVVATRSRQVFERLRNSQGDELPKLASGAISESHTRCTSWRVFSALLAGSDADG